MQDDSLNTLEQNITVLDYTFFYVDYCPTAMAQYHLVKLCHEIVSRDY